MSTMELSMRRKKLFDVMEDGAIALVFSGVAKIQSEDENFKFEVNHNFYYLTGVEQEGCTLMLVKNQGSRKEYLFIPPYDPIKAKWYGKRLSIEEAAQISGLRNVLLENSLQGRIDAELKGSYSDFGCVDKVYLDLSPELKIESGVYTTDYAETLKKRYPGLAVLSLMPLVMPFRCVKSASEIVNHRAACETTRLGIQAMMAAAHPGAKEYELADTFIHTINDDNGFNGIAFNSIIASGAHACTLHYPLPKGEIHDGDLILVDVGARHDYYCGDVSRTFPVNGVFNPTQRMIYSIVLGANKAVAQMAKPGVTIPELQDLTKNYLASECVSHGLLKSQEEISRVYFHGVSHHIGLDVHDVSDRTKPLQAGNIISDEPGLYFEDLGIGVRIEDDLLITEEGCEVLTADIIKEVDDIEAFFARGRRVAD